MDRHADGGWVGVLLAAGRGRRAGGSKQLHPWVTPAGVVPLVAASFDTIRPICDEMVVVLGHEASRVREALGRRSFRWVSGEPEAPMSESIRSGLRAARGAGTHVVLHLGDHPAVSEATLTMLRAAARSSGGCAIMPEFRGRGGHPVIIPVGVAARLIDDPLPGGVRGFWVQHPRLCRRIAVDDRGVVSDLDYAHGPRRAAMESAPCDIATGSS